MTSESATGGQLPSELSSLFWDCEFAAVRGFYLAGGTAVALCLGHSAPLTLADPPLVLASLDDKQRFE